MPDTRWQKSSYSSEAGNCLELARSGSLLNVRESDAPDVIAATNLPRLHALLRSIKTGRFVRLS
ncbi:DUF397 domain-containing protein [Streptomyces sp. 8K308]|uniref:DUF397 domain-containing protein n=1 Tax=Streptomyces sp. 8K308 TaxID=2530388 RepID=UPI001051D062|nr:DUF397 domain-containing protein [Streptomyces sp. 8K308]TDC26249.1 DUF397 domain-containing protein [Streptomyces sp. 8K308]